MRYIAFKMKTLLLITLISFLISAAWAFDPLDVLSAFTPQKPHDRLPIGVPKSYSWQSQSTLPQKSPPMGETKVTGWGQVFFSSETKSGTKAIIEIADLSLWVLSKGDSAWKKIQRKGRISGGRWATDFHSFCGELLISDIGKNSQTFYLDSLQCNAHIWSDAPHAKIDVNNLDGLLVLSSVRSRQTEPNNSSPLVYGLGIDWRDQSGKCPIPEDSKVEICNSIGVGRFFNIDTNWKLVGYTTFLESELLKRPVPPDSAFLLPDGSFPPIKRLPARILTKIKLSSSASVAIITDGEISRTIDGKAVSRQY